MKQLILILTVVAITVGFMTSTATGYIYRSEDEIFLTGNYDEDLYLFGGSINIEGNVRGDIITAGRTVTLASELDGSIAAFGERVTINGDVRRSLYGAAYFFTINSMVEGDVIVFAKEAFVGGDALLTHDAALFGAEVIVDGVVEGNCQLSGGKVTITGRIDGDVHVTADKITISPSAVIGGDLDYESNSRARIAPEAQILGQTRYKKITHSSQTDIEFPITPPPTSWLWSFLFFCGTFIIGLILVLFKRDMVLRIAADMKSRFILHGLLGLLLITTVPLLIVLVAITIIGLPVAAVGITTYALIFLVGKVFVGIALGMAILSLFKREGKVSLGGSLIVGMIALALLFKIPVLGWIIYIAAWAIGAGALTFCFFRRKTVLVGDTQPPTEPVG